jgi:hypothetical protein
MQRVLITSFFILVILSNLFVFAFKIILRKNGFQVSLIFGYWSVIEKGFRLIKNVSDPQKDERINGFLVERSYL